MCYSKRLKKFFQSNVNYVHYDFIAASAKSGIVGNIPVEIIKLFEKKQRAKKIKQFQNVLSYMSNYLRALYKNAKAENLIFYNFNDLGEDLPLLNKSISDDFNKLLKDILPQGAKVFIEYTGRGAWGNVFKMSLVDKNGKKIMHDKAFKVYHSLLGVNKLVSKQGNCQEANFWTFIKFVAGHNLSKTQFTKHYISDVKSGYCMTEFIDDKIQKTTSHIRLKELFKIIYSDYSNEPLNGKLYDAGGMIKMKNFIKDKVVLRYYKKLFYRMNLPVELKKMIDSLENKIANPKTPHRDKIKEALQLFKHEKNIYD